MSEIAEAALDAVRRRLLDVPDGAVSVQAAVEAPGATITAPACNECSPRDASPKITGYALGIIS